MDADRTPTDKARISPELRAFIQQSCDSIALIDVMLFLHADRSRAWTVERLRTELRSSLHSVELQLKKLVSLDLVEELSKDGAKTYQFMASPTMASLVDELARHFASHRSTIISLIYEKDRNSDINAFADVFRFRKD